MHEYLNSFHCTALKAGISTKLHNPEWTKKVFIPSMQVTNLPGYVHIPILHISKTRCLQELRSWAVLKLERVRIPEASHSSFADPKSRSKQVLWETGNSYFLEKMCSIPAFAAQGCWPGEVALLWEPHVLTTSQGFGSHSLKSPIHLFQVFPPCWKQQVLQQLLDVKQQTTAEMGFWVRVSN